MSMVPSVKSQWVNRLRELDAEGNRQGTGALNKGGKMCCLGVLCEIAVEEGLDISVSSYGSHASRETSYEGDANYLGLKVQDWAGLTFNPSFVSDDTTLTLSELNDNGTTFGEIADIIEKEF